MNWTFGADGAIPKRGVIWAADTFLRDKIVVCFLWASLTFEGGKVPVAGHVTFFALFSVVVWVVGRTLADFLDVVDVRMGKSVLLLFELESVGQSEEEGNGEKMFKVNHGI